MKHWINNHNSKLHGTGRVDASSSKKLVRKRSGFNAFTSEMLKNGKLIFVFIFLSKSSVWCSFKVTFIKHTMVVNKLFDAQLQISTALVMLTMTPITWYTINNYCMRLSMISWIIKTEVCVIRHEGLIIHDIMWKPNCIIVLLYIFHIIHPQKLKRSIQPFCSWGELSKGLSNQADVEHDMINVIFAANILFIMSSSQAIVNWFFLVSDWCIII